MCPDGVVAHHESLSSFRPGFESRSGRLFTGKGWRILQDLASPIPFSTFSHVLRGGYDTMPKYAPGRRRDLSSYYRYLLGQNSLFETGCSDL